MSLGSEAGRYLFDVDVDRNRLLGRGCDEHDTDGGCRWVVPLPTVRLPVGQPGALQNACGHTQTSEMEVFLLQPEISSHVSCGFMFDPFSLFDPNYKSG